MLSPSLVGEQPALQSHSPLDIPQAALHRQLTQKLKSSQLAKNFCGTGIWPVRCALTS